MHALGYPQKLEVQELQISGVVPTSAVAGIDSTPLMRSLLPDIGANSEVRRDLFFEFSWRDSSSIKELTDGDSISLLLRLRVDSAFYAQNIFADSLPLVHAAQLVVRWRLVETIQNEEVSNISDSVQAQNWLNWIRNPGDSVVNNVSIALRSTNDSLLFELPKVLADSLHGARNRNLQRLSLQLWIAIPTAERVIRVFGEGASELNRPSLLVRRIVRHPIDSSLKETIRSHSFVPARTAQTGWRRNSDCIICVDLFGGLRESLLVELPKVDLDAAWDLQFGNALEKKPDNRWLVQRAIARIAVTPGNHGSELGYPLPIISSAVQEAIPEIGFARRIIGESPLIDSALIEAAGHPHLLFFSRDTIEIDITKAVRHYFNNRAFGIKPLLSWRLGLPMLRPKDFRAFNYLDESSNLVQVFLNRPAHARYNFQNRQNLAMDIRIFVTNSTMMVEAP